MNLKDAYLHGTDLGALVKNISWSNGKLVIKWALEGKADTTLNTPVSGANLTLSTSALTYLSANNTTYTIKLPSTDPYQSANDDRYLLLAGNSTSLPMKGTIYMQDTDGIYINSDNLDVNIWHVVGNAGSWASQYGFNLQYEGTGTGIKNDLVLWAHKETGSHVEVYRVHLDGQFIFNSTPYVGDDTVMLSSHAANGITATNIANWNSVYTWLTTTTSDTDTTINKWKELEAFLNNITESDTLSGLLADRVAKAGDTMSGALTISTANYGNQLILDRTSATGSWGPSIFFKYDGTLAGSLTMTDFELYITNSSGNDRYRVLNTAELTPYGTRNNLSNKVVTTDTNGYINTGWINTTSGVLNISQYTIDRIYVSKDNYIRYVTPGDFRTQIITPYYVNLTGDTMTGALTTPGLTVTGAATFSQAINGSILGNAATASRLQNARTIALTGSVTGSGTFDGSGNLSIATTTSHSHSYVSTIGKSGSTITWSLNGTAQTPLDFSTTFAPYNANGYLPLTGGTLSLSTIDSLVIKKTSNAIPVIRFTGLVNEVDTFFGRLGFLGVNSPVFIDNAEHYYTLYHTGNLSPLTTSNYTSYAVSLSTNLTISGNKTFSGSTAIDDLTVGDLVVTGGASFALTINGNAATASKLATARTISLTGSVTGSGTFDGSGNLSIATTTNHNHDDRYLKLSGGTLTGDISTASFRSGIDSAGLYIEGNSDAGLRIQYPKTINGSTRSNYDQLLLKNGELKFNNNLVWHAGNDGHNSGLDADTVDTYHVEDLVKKKESATHYPHIGHESGSSIYRVILPHDDHDGEYFLSMLINILGTGSNDGVNGIILLSYSFSIDRGGFTPVDVKGLAVGCSLSRNDVSIFYDRQAASVFYIVVNRYSDNTISIDNLYAQRNAREFDYLATKIRSVESIPLEADMKVAMHKLELETDHENLLYDGYVILNESNYTSYAATSGHTHDYLYSIQTSQTQTSVDWAITKADTTRRGFIYNTSGTEYSYLFGLSGENTSYNGVNKATYGAILKMGYVDKYLRILRVHQAKWYKPDGTLADVGSTEGVEWEKISAGYADSAPWSGITGKPTSKTIWGQTYISSTGEPGSIGIDKVATMPYVLFKNYNDNNTAGYCGRGSGSNNSIQLMGYAGNALSLGANNATGMYFDTSNNVGIGTTSPSHKLHIVGDTYSSTYIYAGTYLKSGSYTQATTYVTAGTYVEATSYVRAKGNDLYIGSAAGSQCHQQYDDTNKVLKFIFD